MQNEPTARDRFVMPAVSFTFVLLVASLARAQQGLPDLRVPDALGVNIHFTDPRPGELEMLGSAGFKWVRMDFDWARIEKTKGEYDFAAYDRLLAAIDKHHIRAVFILDYANPLYDDNRSPDTDAGRSGFANWAVASVQHFKGRGVIWEMYNEPNIVPFWRPNGPNVEDYIKLARAVGQGIKLVAPNELYVGPACSGVDLPFLDACLRAGLLQYWDAVSIHPYGQEAPETRASAYRTLRLMIDRYKPRQKRDKQIPILSGEWGYSSAWSGESPELQGVMLPRQWLFNLSQQVPLSIWYDWHDDGEDPKEPEHHFGTTLHAYHAGRDPVYDPKPAFLAAKTLTTMLGGYEFNKRLSVGAANDYVLLFNKAGDFDDVRIAAWTTHLNVAQPPSAVIPGTQPEAAVPHSDRTGSNVLIPASAGDFEVTSHLGEQLPPLTADARGLAVRLNGAPQYLVPKQRNELLGIAARWKRAPLEVVASRDQLLGADGVNIDLPVKKPPDLKEWSVEGFSIQSGEAVSFGRTFKTALLVPEVKLRLVQDVSRQFGAPFHLTQETTLVVTDPMRLIVQPRVDRLLPIAIENPGGTAFTGTIRVSLNGGAVLVDPIEIKQGQTQALLNRAVPPRKDGDDVVSVELRDQHERTVLSIRDLRLRPIDVAADRFTIRAEGADDVKSEQTITAADKDLPAGLPVPARAALKVVYRFDAGWKYLCVKPTAPELKRIDGTPTALAFWLYADGSGNIPRVRFVDATGQTFQPDAPAMRDKGWTYVRFPLDGTGAGHWGGKADGIVHPPIQLETLLLIDSAARRKTSGTVYLALPALIFGGQDH